MTMDVAREHRRQTREAMNAIGIDDALIARIVDTFYERVRDDAALGPVFEARLAGRWDEHLPKMKAFWSSVALRSGVYSGNPVAAHGQVPGMAPELFDTWLALFRETVDEIAPNPQAADVFKEAAARIARSLRMSLFWRPERDAPGQRATNT
jgi:hemoglobin